MNLSTTPKCYPWQERAWRQLNEQLQQDRLAHAFLLTGAQGLGQLDFALSFAWQMLCQEKTEYACGECSRCRLLIANTHPDLMLVQPEEGSRAIKIDQIRELVRDLQQTPKMGGYQIAIIEPADAMNSAASNALLKTLEEPPGRVLLFLISHHPSALSATILSRCQRIVITVPNKAMVLPWLKQQIAADCNPELILSMALGQPLTALELAAGDYLAERGKWFALFLPKKAWPSVVEISEHCVKSIQAVLEFLQTVLQDLIRLKILAVNVALIHFDQAAILETYAEHGDLIKFYEMFDYLLVVKKQFQGQFHLNPQLILEDVSIRWMQMFTIFKGK